MPKIRKRIRKIRGVYQNTNPPCLIKNYVHITDPEQIPELVAHHYETISGNDSYPAAFLWIREWMEHHLCTAVEQAKLFPWEDWPAGEHCLAFTLQRKRTVSSRLARFLLS